MITFSTSEDRYEVTKWRLLKEGEEVKDVAELSAGDAVKMNVAFVNLKIDKVCVLMIRAFSKEKQIGLLAQEVTIFPDVLPFDLISNSFIIPSGEVVDRIELTLWKDFELVTQEDEDRFLLGKNTHGVAPATLNVKTDSFVKVIEEESENPSSYLGDYEPCKKLFNGAICFAQDSECLWIKDAKYRASANVIRKDRKVWIPTQTAKNLFDIEVNEKEEYIELSTLAEKLGAFCYTNKFGLSVISDLPYDYSETMYFEQGKFMMRLLEFERPKAKHIKQLFKNTSRPRGLGIAEEIKRAVNLAKTDEKAKWLSGKLLELADEFMKQPVQYKLDRERAHSAFLTSIIDYDDILRLYWAHLVTEKAEYKDRLKEHILAMTQLEHWCGDHFYLMTARAMVSCSLALDFLYDDFTEQERKQIVDAIVEKGFKAANILYYGQEDEAKWPWVIRTSNWNYICNSGVIFAACVLFGEYETDMCADELEKAIQSMEYALPYLAPDGELFEGVGYAAYSWNYLVFAFQALYNNFGTAFQLDTAAGTQYSYKIPFTLMSKYGLFTQGDSNNHLNVNTQYALWSARRFSDHSIQCMRHMQIAAEPNGNKAVFTDILWFDDEAYDVAQFDKDYFYESTQSAISRSDWTDDGAILSIHAGDNSLTHCHADLGNFEIGMQGFRFAQEVGFDYKIYCVPGSQYMHREHDNYYMARAEGHNVYVINPDRSLGQKKIGAAVVNLLEQSNDYVSYMIDMESAYRNQVKDAKRYYAMKDNRQVFVIQDEIIPMKQGDKVYWFWHTFAEIAFSDPLAVEIADNTALLTAPNGAKMRLHIDANVPFVMRKGMSLPLETSPAPFDQLQSGIISHLLTLCFETGDEPILLRVTAHKEGENIETEELKPFSEYKFK